MHKKSALRQQCGFSAPCYLTLTFERGALSLLTLAGVGTGHLNLLRMAFAGLIVGAGSSIAGHLRGLAGDIVRIAGPVRSALTKALTAGLVRHLRIPASHTDVILAAGIILIIRTVYNRTIQSCHICSSFRFYAISIRRKKENYASKTVFPFLSIYKITAARQGLSYRMSAKKRIPHFLPPVRGEMNPRPQTGPGQAS